MLEIKVLSKAGRELFIKLLLLYIKVYWSQIFVLKTKVIHYIECTCKNFLWTGVDEIKKKKTTRMG